MESISFSIAGCEIRLLMPFRPEVTRGFQPFLCAPGEAPLIVSLLPVQALPEAVSYTHLTLPTTELV